MSHIPLARTCVARVSNGVPVGAQMAWLSSKSSGTPLDKTRVAEVTHCAVTQGPLAAGGGGSAQPAMTYGFARVTVGWPLTITRGLGTVGCACPACEQRTVAPTWSRKPGIFSIQILRSNHHQATVVDRYSRANHRNRGAFAVLDVDAGIVYDDHCAGWAFEDDAAGQRSGRRIAEHQRVL